MLSIATYNLENLFRPGTGAGPDSDEVYQAKLTAVAETTAGLAPDVLAVQEVGEPDALADLVGWLDGDWHTALADPGGRGIRVGVLSRLPFTASAQVVQFPDKLDPVQVGDDGTTLRAMGRPALHVRIETEDAALDLISCHLKFKLLSFPGGFSPQDEDQRPATPSTPSSDGRPRRRPSAPTPLRLIPEPQRFSRVYRGRGELIDHLLVSHRLVTVVKTVTTGDIEVPSITDKPRAQTDKPGSDHRPVVGRFELG